MTVHLVSIDGSTCAQKAVELALRTMNMELDTIHLVSIVQKVVTIPPAAMDVPFYPANMSVDVSATKARENQAIKLLQAYKNFYCGLDGKSKVVVPADRFHTAVLEGTDTAQDVMLKYMENNPTDILYVGCRGLGAFKRMVLGSFSTYMINHAPCPVFVVHDHKDGEYPKEDEPLDRLVCVDGSPESDKAFHIALKTMKKKDTLHVMVGVPRYV
eukprot:TRINITY_DN7_c0_g1_i5.p1 TRINITY_DN7_c0_g1~~TRINITY_DN7_c0_g1_i5.p1  ORF type:complete len:214 (-),score=69.15 TRINITY_DN7_c0_g1_i5:1965-2606(-)